MSTISPFCSGNPPTVFPAMAFSFSSATIAFGGAASSLFSFTFDCDLGSKGSDGMIQYRVGLALLFHSTQNVGFVAHRGAGHRY